MGKKQEKKMYSGGGGGAGYPGPVGAPNQGNTKCESLRSDCFLICVGAPVIWWDLKYLTSSQITAFFCITLNYFQVPLNGQGISEHVRDKKPVSKACNVFSFVIHFIHRKVSGFPINFSNNPPFPEMP